MKKIAAMADATLANAPHNRTARLYSGQYARGRIYSNFVIMEKGSKETEDYKNIFVDGWKATLAEWKVPESPGLGADISPEFLREREIKITG
jgi:L-alanine-DL-glutamate epimerase-like enolase superfamily enzyme